jgi:hypothetical protein
MLSCRWLLETGQEEKAGLVKEREGDYLGAVSLYLKGGLPARAAQVSNAVFYPLVRMGLILLVTRLSCVILCRTGWSTKFTRQHVVKLALYVCYYGKSCHRVSLLWICINNVALLNKQPFPAAVRCFKCISVAGIKRFLICTCFARHFCACQHARTIVSCADIHNQHVNIFDPTSTTQSLNLYRANDQHIFILW